MSLSTCSLPSEEFGDKVGDVLWDGPLLSAADISISWLPNRDIPFVAGWTWATGDVCEEDKNDFVPALADIALADEKFAIPGWNPMLIAVVVTGQ
jgi:hypothetical protein